MLMGKHSDAEKPWHAGGMGQQESHEVQQSQMQSSAPGVADWQDVLLQKSTRGLG